MSGKPIILLDTECYVDYWLVRARRIGSPKPDVCIELNDNEALAATKVKLLVGVLRFGTIVTFNGADYDVPMILYALSSPNPTTVQLKALSDNIIQRGLRGWQVGDFAPQANLRTHHIDLREVAPGVQISQKQYAGRMHSRKIQDLPIPPDAETTATERALIRDYCGNDIDNLADLWAALAKQVELRTALSLEYGIDLRSKSDAQIAEAVLRSELSKSLGYKVSRPALPDNYSFKYTPPTYIGFRSAELRAALAGIKSAVFYLQANGSPEMPPELDKLKIKIGSAIYKMGIGGLHSTEKRAAHVESAEHFIEDNDVASFYPAIKINHGLFPRHIGPAYLGVYSNIVQRRLAAKRDGNKTVADSLKITINGAYGKLGSPWSSLYSPDLMIYVTLTGQLALLMLIEMLEDIGVEVVSANTDGVVSKCPRHLEGNMRAAIAAWEKLTKFDTEATRYKALYSRDVNNYIAIKTDGKIKGKGAYVPATGDAFEALRKSPDAAIVVDAVCAKIADGIDVETTISKCRDIRKFVSVKRVTGGGVWANEYLGKVARWYNANSGVPIVYKSNGNKVGKTDGSKPLMELPDEFPDDVNYDYYITAAHDALRELAFVGGH